MDPRKGWYSRRKLQKQRPRNDFWQTVCPMAPSAHWGFLSRCFRGTTIRKSVCLLVGIEEPEGALHPAAAGVLLDALREAAGQTQIIITSHSPDLLDDKDLDPESILAVDAPNGTTVIAGVDEAGRSVLRDRLYTTGELLRINQLQPDPASIDAAKERYG